VFPLLFGIGTLAALTLWALGIANRVVFEASSAFGGICQPAPSGASFESRSLCYASGFEMVQGQRYRIELHLPAAAAWRDDSIPVETPAGFHALSPGLTLRQRLVFAAAAPFRRMWSANWFVPVARIGAMGVDQYPLTQRVNELTARSSGQLFLFVNDAVAPLGPCGVGWSSYYCNNAGVATITVAEVPPVTP
jgi:hypothetical protein